MINTIIEDGALGRSKIASRRTTSRVILHTALAGSSRVGVDLRPFFRRLRDVMLRPIRHEMAAEVAELRATIDQLRAARRDDAELTRAAFAVMEKTSAHLAQKIDQAECECQQIERDRQKLSAGVADLEMLLTSSTAVRPPGAAQILAAMPSPVVSVVVPTLNRAPVVADAIASVQAQQFRDWELIVVDDGSTDSTASIVEPFLADKRIRYVYQPSAGVAAARNHGIRLARGPLIAYLDSDNVWYPGFLSAAVDALATNPTTDIVYGALVTDVDLGNGARILWSPFDRQRLESGSYIDTNVIVHRKGLVDQYGGWDERLRRLVDWDLVLRYTEHRPAHRLPALAARYRDRAPDRITVSQPAGPAHAAIQAKWYPAESHKRRPRVLYAVWHYPQLSETYIETEIRQMRAWGVHVELWRETGAASSYPSSVPIHDGSLAEAVARARPDLIHVHWLTLAYAHRHALAATGRPVTLRLHGFEVTIAGLQAWLEQPNAHAVYALPHHVAALEQADARVRTQAVPFETALFQPHRPKNRRLVIRTGAALASKDIRLFFELAKRLPEHRFVFAGVTAKNLEGYVEELRAIHRELNSPAELLFDVPREALVPLVAQAGIYFHTAHPPRTEHSTPIGMPISIAEAMATGAFVLVRDLPELATYVGDAGATYTDLEHAAKLIAATTAWSDEVWENAWMRSVERAFGNHADGLVLRPMFEDWCALVPESGGVT